MAHAATIKIYNGTAGTIPVYTPAQGEPCAVKMTDGSYWLVIGDGTTLLSALAYASQGSRCVAFDATTFAAGVTARSAAGGEILMADSFSMSSGLTVPQGIFLKGSGPKRTVITYTGTSGYALTFLGTATTDSRLGGGCERLSISIPNTGGSGVEFLDCREIVADLWVLGGGGTTTIHATNGISVRYLTTGVGASFNRIQAYVEYCTNDLKMDGSAHTPTWVTRNVIRGHSQGGTNAVVMNGANSNDIRWHPQNSTNAWTLTDSDYNEIYSFCENNTVDWLADAASFDNTVHGVLGATGTIPGLTSGAPNPALFGTGTIMRLHNLTKQAAIWTPSIWTAGGGNFSDQPDSGEHGDKQFRTRRADDTLYLGLYVEGGVTTPRTFVPGPFNVTGITTLATSLSGLAKLTAGVVSAAVAGTDYYNPGGTDVAITDGGTGVSTLPAGLLKGAGTGAITAGVSGTDYAPPTATTSSLKGNGAGGFSAATLNDNGAPTADFSMASHKLTNVTDGSSAQDAVTKNQLDAKAPLASPTFTGTVTLPTGLTGLAKMTAGVVSAAVSGTDYPSPTAPQQDDFSATGTWTKPAGAVRVRVVCIGGGAGGGSGRCGGAATVRCGGGGGGAGMRVEAWLLASDLGSTETVTVGVGGAGGTAIAAPTTDGNSGAAGGASAFGGAGVRWLQALAATGGGGGTATTGTSGSAAGPGCAAGAAASTTGLVGAGGNTATARGTSWTAGAGGAGGGITSGNVDSAGGVGAPSATGTTTPATGGTASTGVAGGAGTAAKTGSRQGGCGGAGGGSNSTGTAGTGGAGGGPGGGGGGGGSALGSGPSGAGGAGADGAVYITSYFS